MSERRWLAILTAITLFAVLRVAATHRVFSGTLDEPGHIASSHDWWRGDGYDVDPSHPPLARILIGLPIVNLDPATNEDLVRRGNQLLYANNRYEKNLARARIGNLPLLIALLWATAYWGRRAFGPTAGLIAAALLACMPPILAHAGLATTDLAVAAMLPLVLLALSVWRDEPTRRNATLLGIALGLGLLSKFSFILFFPFAALPIVVKRLRREHLRTAFISLAVAALVIWGGYRFDVRKAGQRAYYLTEPAPAFTRPAVTWITGHIPLPAVQFAVGMGIVKLHDREGHLSYLLGRTNETGWWYYFPVVLFYKTPLPFLAFVLCGAVWAIRKRDGPLVRIFLSALALLAIIMTAKINIGIRHLLPIYPMLAIVAAAGVLLILKLRRERIATALLIAWFAIGTTRAHPDYLSWFNEAAGGHPERVAVDSNLDWGQDIYRLRRVVKRRGIDNLRWALVDNTWLFAQDIRGEPLRPFLPQRGWIAVSESALVLWGSGGEYRWLTETYRPVERVGTSIRLYYVP